jgi:manganese/iron transport system substrate-binding protein
MEHLNENDFHYTNLSSKMLKNKLLTACYGVAIAFTVGLLSACNQSSPTRLTSSVVQGDGPKVVATTTVICDLTKQIAAHTVDLTCPIEPRSDPHVYEPTPSDRKSIEEAKLILYGGYNLEPSLIKLIRSTSNAADKIAVDEAAVPHPQTFQENGKTEADPHVWQNAQNGVRMVEIIQRSLTKVAPANAALYAKNAKVIVSEISQIDGWIKSQVATIPLSSRKLVTTHDALGYYSKAYGIPVEGALGGINTEEKPTATRIKTLVKVIQDTKVPTIFAERTINPKLIEAVAKDAKVKVSDQELFADGLGEAGSEGETYQKMLISNTRAIVQGLGGTYTPFKLKGN